MFSCCLGRGSTSETPHAHGSKRLEVDARKLNDSLYELWKPSGTPKVELLFFHGLQFGDLSDAHLRTWESEDGSFLWPQKWLVEEFPMARILCVSYDGGVRKSSGRSFDMHIIVENLISDFMQEKTGQTPNCPVVLIGHCFGGLVIEKLCLEANKLKQVGLESQRPQIGTFLDNVKGVFFYSVPHHGSPGLSKATKLLKSPLLSYFETLGKDASRLGFEFNQLRRVYAAWQIWGLGENLPGDWGMFDGIVAAPEATARNGDNFNLLAVDHMSISKPQNKADKRFYFLTQLLNIIATNSEAGVPTHECYGLPKYPIELESRALDLRNKLIGATTLGIFGMGGIGKTTLAKKAFNSISKGFEYTCFVDNVKGIQLQGLGDWLLNHFHQNGKKTDSASISWFDLKDKETLIVMDDIDSVDQLRVLPDLKHFGTGSRVIMTSRDKEVFKFYADCNIYEVDFLKKEDGKKLFCQYAFDSEHIPEPLIDYVNPVVEKCGGLPLTLEVIGTYLRGRNGEVWMETIDRLRTARAINGSKNDRVWASLRISYDALLKEEQEMFTAAALFFFDRPVDRALAAWSSESQNLPTTTWENLVSRSLVKEINNNVWVHEHLRDLAENVSKDSMIFGSDESSDSAVTLLNDNQVKGRTEYLRLLYSDRFQNNRRTLNLDSLADLDRLKYIHLVRVPSRGCGNGLTRKISFLEFEGAPGNEFSKLELSLNQMENLAVLELSRFRIPNEFLEGLGNLTNLHILCLSDLHGVDRLPENFGSLRRLRQLELKNLSSMILPKSFGNLVALEVVTFRSIKSFQLPESLGDLSSLVKLVIVDCEELAGLPESFGRRLTSLKELYIDRCPSIKCLPESLGDVSSLVKLRIYKCEELVGLPESFGRRLTSLKELYISYCPAFKCLPESLGDVSSLVKLTIYRCEKLAGLPESFGSSLPSLEELDIIFCPLIKCLPECFSRLPGLQQLHIHFCYGFKELGNGFGNLSSLRELSLRRVALDRLPASLSLLSVLEILEIRTGGQLRSLPDDFGELRALKKLSISSPGLKALPESFRFPKFLQKIEINCPKLKSLPESLGDLAQLKKLVLNVQRAECLPLIVGNLHSMRHLTFKSSVAKLLPDSLGQLSSLKTLELDCPNLEMLPDILVKLSSLEEMSFSLPNLASLPESFGELHNLRKLALRMAENLKSLPKDFGELIALQDLIIHGDELERLPDSFPGLKSLKTFRINCPKLERLPDAIGNLSSLRELSIRSKILESLPESIGQLHSLEKLTLGAGKSVRSLLDSIEKNSPLHEFEFEFDCYGHEKKPNLFAHISSFPRRLTLRGHYGHDDTRILPTGLGGLLSLKHLKLSFLRHLETVPDELGTLSSLESLTIVGCDMLESLPNSLGQVSSLEKVSLLFCRKLKTLPKSLGMHQQALPQGDQSDQLRWQAEESSEPKKTEAMTLSVEGCPLLDDSVLEGLGWMFVSESRRRRHYCARNLVVEKSVHPKSIILNEM